MKRLVFLLLFNTTLVFGQINSSDMAPGLVPYQSFHGGEIDKVNLADGGLTVIIPLVSYPQRGGKLKLDFSLAFNSKLIVYEYYCIPLGGAPPPPNFNPCTWMWTPNYNEGLSTSAPAGWRIADMQDIKTGEYVKTISLGGTPFNPNQIEEFYGQVMTADGSVHPMGQINNPANTSIPYEGQVALDGSGFSSGADTDQTIVCTVNCFIQDGKGLVYYPAAGVLREDSNGNQILEGTTGYTDTFGRTIPPVPSRPANEPEPGCYSWNPPGANGSTLSFSFCYEQITYSPLPQSLSNGSVGPPATIFKTVVLSSVSLPNGTSWQFGYDTGEAAGGTFGDLTSITFPTGGTLSYTYISEDSFSLGGSPAHLTRWVASRTENYGQGDATWNYGYNGTQGSTTTPPTSVTNNSTTTVTDPYANTTVHKFGITTPPAYETSTQWYAGANSGTPLRAESTAYSYFASGAGYITPPGSAVNVFPLLKTTVLNNRVATTKTWNYCMTAYSSDGCDFSVYADAGGSVSGFLFGLPTDETVYDYTTNLSCLGATSIASCTPGSLLSDKQTAYLFQSNPAYFADTTSSMGANLLSLEAWEVIYGPASHAMPLASKTFYYDESAYTGMASSVPATLQFGLPIFTSVTGSALAGNLTTTTRQMNTAGAAIQSHSYWYDTGELYQSIDPNGNAAATYQYSLAYAGGLPTQVTDALGHTASYQYDFNLGLKALATDPNGASTTYCYDNIGRTTRIIYPDAYPAGGQSQAVGAVTPCQSLGIGRGQTEFSYQDGYTSTVSVTRFITPKLTEMLIGGLDGYGRLTNTALTSDPDGTTYTQTSYDAVGRRSQEWSPTRCYPANVPCGESTWGVTTHVYDALSREIATVPPDGTVPTGSATCATNDVCSTFSGNQAVSVDQAGVSRTKTEDALGRITQVSEDNMGYTTQYGYDALGNLVCAQQPGLAPVTAPNPSPIACSSANSASGWRVRTFTYDSLSRLLTSSNPEAGIIYYGPGNTSNCAAGYDNNGNLLCKTDARGISTMYQYDSDNRLTEKYYSDAGSAKQPVVTYSYDQTGADVCGNQVSYGIGRRTGMTDLSGSTTWSYDPMGREWSEVRIIGSSTSLPNPICTLYNLDGSEYQLTYPSGATLVPTMSGAGRPIALRDTFNGINYASGLTYAPTGQLTGGTFSSAPSDSPAFTGYQVLNSYNSHGQPIALVTNTTTPVVSILNMTYDYGLGVNDNGNVYSVTDNVQNIYQTFTYDGVNRLITAMGNAMSNGTMDGQPQQANWVDSYTYDAWGNRIGAGQPATALPNQDPNAIVPENFNQPVNSNNQFATGYKYDPAGNLTYDGVNAYQYDEESRISATAFMAGGPQMYYLYNGEGERVAKLSAAEEANLNGPTGEGCVWAMPIGGTVGIGPVLSSNQALTPVTTSKGNTTWANFSGSGGGPVGPAPFQPPLQLLLDAKLYWGNGLAESDVCGNITKEYVYLNGARIALNDSTDQTGGVYYYFSDHLGSSSIVTDDQGDVVDESLFYPFGEENQIQSGSGQHYKFTGKERDTESGLDNFGARYYSSNLARFMTPDWAEKPAAVPFAIFGDPQSLNMYEYVVNNPESKVDPDGHLSLWHQWGDESSSPYSGGGETSVSFTPGDDPGAQATNNAAANQAPTTTAQPPAPAPAPATPPAAQQNGNQPAQGQNAGGHWQYSQASHTMEHVDANGKVTNSTSNGVYSGEGTGQNNPAAQSVSNAQSPGNSGPIPQGTYTIGDVHTGTSERGSTLNNSMRLEPSQTTNTFGRSDFSIHGDSVAHPGHASWGCIVMPPGARSVIIKSSDRTLEVVP